MSATASPPTPIAVPPDALARVRETYERGRYLQAWEQAKAVGPLERWAGTDAQILAGRLAMNLGAPSRGGAMHLLAWRRDPRHLGARYYGCMALLRSRGPLALLRRTSGEPEPAAPRPLADWCALHAVAHGLLRDFDRARGWLDRALAAAPREPWMHCERAHLLHLAHEDEAALEAARHALSLRRWYRPAVLAVAEAQDLLDRPDEALALLDEARAHLESAGLEAMRAGLLARLGRHADARGAWEDVARLAPLAEPDHARWLAGRRADAAWTAGDHDAALPLMEAAGGVHARVLASVRRAPVGGRRVELPVPFVRQHHDTCAPASIAMVCAFWGVPGEHLEVAAEICYDGTAAHSERRWAEANGFRARELTLEWDAARAALDRGCPLLLATCGASMGHLQVVIGYDARRETLLVRDPNAPGTHEMLLGPLLRRHRAHGPRALLIVPEARAALLDGLALPDAALHDHAHAMQRALERHDRDAAGDELARLREAAPEHRITLHAERTLAAYDADAARQLSATRRLRELEPRDAWLVLAEAGLLRALGRREDRLALLRAACADLLGEAPAPADEDAPPTDEALLVRLAVELAEDGREHARASALLRRVARRRPLDVDALRAEAELRWDAGDRAQALERFRLAAGLADKDEGLARTWFLAARALGQGEDALAALRARFERLGDRSALPARTLAWALELEGHDPTPVLEAAVARRARCGETLLFAAEAWAGRDRLDLARELLERAQDATSVAAWRRVAARIALARGDAPVALALWRTAVEADPLDVAAHEAVARLVSDTDGIDAACQHLERAATRARAFGPLQRLWVSWLREADPTAGEPQLHDLLLVHPTDAWMQRELALLLARSGRVDEALRRADLACALEPASPAGPSIRGEIHRRAGRLEAAEADLRRALELEPDAPLAIAGLVRLSDDQRRRREAVEWVLARLLRGPTDGTALEVLAAVAQDALPPAEVEELLARAWRRSPERWWTWAPRLRHLAARGRERSEEALALAREAAAKFPLQPRLWLEVALVYEVAGQPLGQADALERALALAPEHDGAARALVDLLVRAGDLDRARRLLSRAVVAAPFDGRNHAGLAEVLWRKGERDAALDRLERAVRLEPTGGAWPRFVARCAEHGAPGRPDRVVRDLVRLRPRDPRGWLRLAVTLQDPDAQDERLRAARRAIDLDPTDVGAHDLHAELLGQAGRHDEALAACKPAALPTQPLELRGRALWVDAVRGNVERAHAGLQELVRGNPDYGWGVRNLLAWGRALGRPQDLELTRHLVTIDPLDPSAHAQLGAALLRVADEEAEREAAPGLPGEAPARRHAARRREGRACLARAVELAPDDAWAVRALVDAALEDDDLDQAEATLARAELKPGDPWRASCDVVLAARRGRRDDALAALAALTRVEAEAPWPFEDALSALGDAGWLEDAERVLRETLEDPRTSPETGAAWVRACAGLERAFACAPRLEQLRRLGGVGRRGTEALLEVAASRGEAGWLVAYVEQTRETLHRDASSWGVAGEALFLCGEVDRAVEWLGSWRSWSSALRPWMVAPLAVGLRRQARDEEAAAVSRHALGLEDDGASGLHRLWLAVDALQAGDAPAAARLLDRAGPPVTPYQAFLRDVVAAAVDARRAPGGPVLERFDALLADNAELVKRAELARALRRCAWSASDGLTGRLWWAGFSLRLALA